MAENNSSAPLKTAEGAATLWCVHVTGADDVHPMPSREVALEEANALNTSICRIKRQDIDPVLIAVVAEWPHSADSHAAGLMIREECLRMRGEQAVAAQAAPAAVAVPENMPAAYLHFAPKKPELRRVDFLRNASKSERGCGWITIPLAPFQAAPTPALPATEDSSAGDLAEVQASTLQEIAIEELYQLGYTFKDGRLIPPDHVGELMSVVQGSACGCQYGTCETKANRACRMTAEVREQAQEEVQAEPVAMSTLQCETVTKLLELARIVDRAVEDWGESLADGSSNVIFHKEEADARDAILDFLDSLPENPDPMILESGPVKAARLLSAPQAQPADALDAQHWRDHIGKLDALVTYCPTCCQGFTAKPEMTRDEVIFECGKTAGRSAAMTKEGK
ncbi:hypothetical protein [Comamonas sp. 23]|uniref:hypothetical protein n=1 Tax=Comamonas sp. 23 TaxID=3415008 RepID=UPI003C6F8EA3